VRLHLQDTEDNGFDLAGSNLSEVTNDEIVSQILLVR